MRMKLPRFIIEKIANLPDGFMGSFTVDTDGNSHWKIAVTDHEREKNPEEWVSLDKMLDKQ